MTTTVYENGKVKNENGKVIAVYGHEDKELDICGVLRTFYNVELDEIGDYIHKFYKEIK